MKDLSKAFVRFAGAGAVAALLASPAFAAGRGNDNQYDRGRGDDRRVEQSRDAYDNHSYRENQRVNATGRVTAFSRERDGYRVQLDRGGSFFVPQSRLRNHVNDLRVGINISLGGIFRGGRIDVDAISWPGDGGGYGYGATAQGYVRGVVQNVDYRRNVMTMRDDASGRLIDVDLRETRRTSRLDANDLRRGDYVTLSGDWLRGGVFSAYQIESVRTR
jgi:hypothetical protein